MGKTIDTSKLQFSQVGENIQGAVMDDGVMLLAIDTKTVLRDSASGKSQTIATTGGNVLVGGVKVGVNVYRPLGKDDIAKRDRENRAAAIAAEQAKQDAKTAA